MSFLLIIQLLSFRICYCFLVKFLFYGFVILLKKKFTFDINNFLHSRPLGLYLIISI